MQGVRVGAPIRPASVLPNIIHSMGGIAAFYAVNKAIIRRSVTNREFNIDVTKKMLRVT
jgi:hypothetical protein